ncbi:uncharacterized protein PHACADRAFT_261086 [Phanerochaete carnosa HHB-10118-sp]|uniref:PARP catalytic domain-containing protein n=1 Tax=Phanerochaete carnosa (strain HHB-10118-sp) TaxID=650164 RepID=K5W110_PHACS|nr:uncharacterized protein PHACADRAFT_261086 [Phanerochaete carnosa HHB-10118-sp]EKM52579.1 hypothetical protein PHACADRAFT_261086 [Phanerochaete carnosa HHB-10118-sp]
MNSATICALPGCYVPVWIGNNGQPSQYCSRSHMAAASHQPQRPQRPRLCKNCQAKPVYTEPGKVHDFCGRTCASAYAQSGKGGHQPPHAAATTGPSAGVDMCLLCDQRPRTFVNGKLSDFCSIKCRDSVHQGTPAILEVPKSQDEWRSVVQQFGDQWKSSPKPPDVVKVYKIYSPQSHIKKFLSYKTAVGNSRRRWHGTARQCRIGDDAQNTGFCTNSGCRVCSILQNSFQVEKAARGQFGVGIYTSATSSKANSFINNAGGSSYRALLLNEVIMGKTCKLQSDDTTLNQPPAGYDSVVGEPGKGLQHDEAIVYKNEAIRPLYLIIFKP